MNEKIPSFSYVPYPRIKTFLKRTIPAMFDVVATATALSHHKVPSQTSGPLLVGPDSLGIPAVLNPYESGVCTISLMHCGFND